jgi:hypothetical protein
MGCGLIVQTVLDGFARPDLELLGIGAWTGGVCGLVLGPLAIFGFMRRVPLGRLFIEMCIGTIVAGTIGLLLPLGIYSSLAVAAVGFLGAGARLAWRYRSSAGQPSLPNAR